MGIKKHVENQAVLCASFVIFAMGRAVLSMDGCAAKRRPRGLQLFAVEAGAADISGTERTLEAAESSGSLRRESNEESPASLPNFKVTNRYRAAGGLGWTGLQ